MLFFPVSFARQVGHSFRLLMADLMQSSQKIWPQIVEKGETIVHMQIGQLKVGSFAFSVPPVQKWPEEVSSGTTFSLTSALCN